MMNDLIVYLFLLLIGGVIGLFLGKLTTKVKLQKETSGIKERNSFLVATLEKANADIQLLNTTQQADQLKKEELMAANIRLETEHKNVQLKLTENKADIEQLQQKFTKEFENLATKILEEKSTKFTAQNKENLNTILSPLKEKIDFFEKRVENTQKESIGMHAALKTQLEHLKDLNLQMSKEAVNLTKALKGDNKVQGDWGETQLEILLEKANLTKDIHFSTQGGYRDDEGKLKKPDFIVNLPDNRHLVIDSKVSLTNYESYFSTEDENEQKLFLKKHIESLRSHIKDLSSKKYESLYEINSPDYVLMFVPIEPALMLALNSVNNLYLEALDKNIVLVSTSTLLATLSTVSSMWRQENQKRNVLEIANQAGKLYDQFVSLTDDLIKVGNQLKTVQGSYDTSMKKLTGKGNLIKKVENIKILGAKTSKNLNQNLLDRALED